MSVPLPSSVVVTSGASGGNVTVTLPSGMVNDDTVTIALLQDIGGTTITQRAGTTGWTIRQPTGVTGGVRLCLAYKVHGGRSQPGIRRRRVWRVAGTGVDQQGLRRHHADQHDQRAGLREHGLCQHQHAKQRRPRRRPYASGRR